MSAAIWAAGWMAIFFNFLVNSCLSKDLPTFRRYLGQVKDLPTFRQYLGQVKVMRDQDLS